MMSLIVRRSPLKYGDDVTAPHGAVRGGAHPMPPPEET
jgi:hypothetical protein